MYAHNSSKRFQKKKWKYYFTKLDIHVYESLRMCMYLCEVYLSDSVKFCGANLRVSGNRGFLIFNQL